MKYGIVVDSGIDFETICERIEAYCKQTHLLFVLKSLDNFIKNGRVSKVKGTIAGLLGIKLLGVASAEGDLELLQKCRGKLTAYENLKDEMLARGYKGGKVIIAHCFAPELAKFLSNSLRELFSDCSIEIMPTSGLCSYYAEQGGILVGFES